MNRYVTYTRQGLATIWFYISKWNWSNIFTLIALIFSIYQNSVSDNRYNKNEEDNNKELKRISKKDSVQAHSDSVQTQVLINEYRSQVAENKRNRVKDSSQLSLFSSQIALLNQSLLSQNRALTIQNQSLEVQRLQNQADLTLLVNVLSAPLTGFTADISPVISFTNTGMSTAQNIDMKCCFITIENWNAKRKISCSSSTDYRITNFFLKPGQSTSMNVGCGQSQSPIMRDDMRNAERAKADHQIDYGYWAAKSIKTARSKLDSLDELYPFNPHKYYLINKISYKDKYQNTRITIYTASEILHIIDPALAELVQFRTAPIKVSELNFLRECLTKNDFDYNEIVKITKEQPSGSSTFLYQ